MRGGFPYLNVFQEFLHGERDAIGLDAGLDDVEKFIRQLTGSQIFGKALYAAGAQTVKSIVFATSPLPR